MPETNPNESSAWDKAKRAALELFNRKKIDATKTAQPESDKTQMLFVLADKDDPEVFDRGKHSWGGDYSENMDKGASGEMGGHPTIYYLNSAKEGIHDPGVVIRTIREHVQKYGTLKELRISGHGYRGHMGMSADLDLREFLSDLEKLQKEEGFKISDRIVFDGCNVLASLFKDDEQVYKQNAERLGAEIAGATTLIYGAEGGRFIKFTPDGDVRRDILDDPKGYQAGKIANRKLGASDPSWYPGADDWAEREITKPTIQSIPQSRVADTGRNK